MWCKENFDSFGEETILYNLNMSYLRVVNRVIFRGNRFYCTGDKHPELMTSDEYARFRKSNLEEKIGVNGLYPNKFHVSFENISDFCDKFEYLDKNEKNETEKLTIAGRVDSIRIHGKKLCFIDIKNDDLKLQIKVSKSVHKGKFDPDCVKKGDIIGISGYPGRTKAGELSVLAEDVRILTPCLRRIPGNLDDVYKRFQRKYADFLVNPEKKSIFHTRATVIRGN